MISKLPKEQQILNVCSIFFMVILLIYIISYTYYNILYLFYVQIIWNISLFYIVCLINGFKLYNHLIIFN